ncbi:MAG: tetratricopeptide repeat protein [Kofleriaceae bacterium]
MLALMRQSNAAEEAGDAALTQRLLERCLELDDGGDTAARGRADLPPFRLRPYLTLANLLLEQADFAPALGILTRARDRWPDDPSLHLVFGRCYQRQQDWARCELAYRRSFELQPRAYICTLIAAALDKLRRPRQAVWWLRHTLVVDPDYEEAHFNLGCLDDKRGKRDAAEQRFRRALELDPDYADAHDRLGDLLLDRAMASLVPTQHRDWPAALAHLTRAVELAPDKEDRRDLLTEMHLEASRAGQTAGRNPTTS